MGEGQQEITVTCPLCKEKFSVVIPEFPSRHVLTTCQECGGTGHAGADQCGSCHGKGVL